MNDITELAAFTLKMTTSLPGGQLNASARITPLSGVDPIGIFFASVMTNAQL